MRRAGFDSGSAYLGLIVADGDVAPLSLVAMHDGGPNPRTFEVGRMVPYPEPVVRTWKDGTVHTYTHERKVTAEDEEAAAVAVVEQILDAGVDELVIEHAAAIYVDTEAGRAGASKRASNVLIGERIAREVAVRAKLAGVRVVLVPRSTWVSRVAGKSRSTDTEIAPHVVDGYVDWPEQSTKDQRDAGGALLWHVLPPVARKRYVSRSRAERREQRRIDALKLGPPRPSKEEWREMRKLMRPEKARQRAETRAAKRAEVGCACPGHGHRWRCPLATRGAVPHSYVVW